MIAVKQLQEHVGITESGELYWKYRDGFSHSGKLIGLYQLKGMTGNFISYQGEFLESTAVLLGLRLGGGYIRTYAESLETERKVREKARSEVVRKDYQNNIESIQKEVEEMKVRVAKLEWQEFVKWARD